MELPANLRAAVDRMLEGVSTTELRAASARLTERYRAETLDGRLHLDGALAVKAYLAARLPATFAAVRQAMELAADALPDFSPTTLLDVGAGPGTALWAAQDCWNNIGKAQMLEASNPALVMGEVLSAELGEVTSTWIGGDAARDLEARPSADLVTLCYVLDELAPAQQAALTQALWAKTTGLLLIVEPGTPAGWKRILAARAALVEAGAHIAAPCPHEAPCPLAAPDWCHFSRRVARSRIHRQVKSGEVPWEDEKFIFIAASRDAPPQRLARVLAPPRQTKAGVELKLCQPDGGVAHVQIGKRDGEAWRVARKLDWGDALDL